MCVCVYSMCNVLGDWVCGDCVCGDCVCVVIVCGDCVWWLCVVVVCGCGGVCACVVRCMEMLCL